MLDKIRHFLVISIGVFISAIAFSRVLLPNHLTAVGLGGIATIINNLTSWNIQLVLLALCMPIIIWALFKYDKKQVLYAGYCVLLFTFLIGWVELYIPEFKTDAIIAAVVAGVIFGISTGLILREGVANGPEAILGLYLKDKKGITIGNFFLILNIIIVFSSIVYSDITYIIYSFISIYISSKVTDAVILGATRNYSVHIISEEYMAITEYIHKELKRSATFVQAMGTYELKKKMLIMTVVSNSELILLRKYVNSLNDQSFLYVTVSSEVIGGGFMKNK